VGRASRISMFGWVVLLVVVGLFVVHAKRDSPAWAFALVVGLVIVVARRVYSPRNTKFDLRHSHLGVGGFVSAMLRPKRTLDHGAACQALVATPYNILPGGGERYLLEAAGAFQRIPCDVTIGLFSRTQCEGDCIATVVTKLGVALDPAGVTVIELPQDMAFRTLPHEEVLAATPYDFFFLLGNEKLPQVQGLGRVNLYMCQFPFDWARPSTALERANLFTYQMVLLNSEYTHGWYTDALERSRLLKRPCAPVPTVLYPPVEAVPSRGAVRVTERPLRIVMLGRIFDDRQQKGHMEAIKAFRRLQAAWLAAPLSPDSDPSQQRPLLELYLVGAVMKGHRPYATRVKWLAENVTNVHVLFDASRRRVLKILRQSRVVWSLTGFRQNRIALGKLADRLSNRSRPHRGRLTSFPNGVCDVPDDFQAVDDLFEDEKCPDPADTEHFGIAVTEAMSAGAIPVLLSMGGLAELVPSQRVGRLAAHVSEVVSSTLEVLSQTDAQLHAMSMASIEASARFTGTVFQRRLKAIVHKGHLPRFWTGLSSTLCSESFDLSAAYAAADFAYDFELNADRSSVSNASYPLEVVGLQKMNGRRKMNHHTRGSRASYAVKRASPRLIAVIVDTRVDYTFATAVKSNFRYLQAQAWRLRVVHGSENARFVRDALADVRPVEYMNIGVTTMTEYDYNSLLKTPSFWRSMNADRALVFQTDGLLLRTIPWMYLQFDWVGAPWTPDNDAYKGINEDKVPIPPLDPSVRVGNGGLSLRNTHAMERVCLLHAAESKPQEQEDVFLVRSLHRHGYQIADLKSAANFALEVPIPEHAVDPRKLVAIHQAWFFVSPELLTQLLQIICNGKCGLL